MNKRAKFLRFGMVAMLTLFLAACGGSGSSDSGGTTFASAAGVWTGPASFDGGVTYNVRLTLTQSGNTIGGSYLNLDSGFSADITGSRSTNTLNINLTNHSASGTHAYSMSLTMMSNKTMSGSTTSVVIATGTSVEGTANLIKP